MSKRYTQFKKYFSKSEKNDRLSKRGINLIFSKTKEGNSLCFFRYRSENYFIFRGKQIQYLHNNLKYYGNISNRK